MTRPPTEAVRPNAAEAALGDAAEWAIQRWVAWTGREVEPERVPWLDGPTGEGRIGAGFYDAYARESGLRVVRDDAGAGLLEDFEVLRGEGFEPARVRPEIRYFYERTARFGLDVRVEWRRPSGNPPRTFLYLVGRTVEQMNLPVASSVADVAMSNEVIRLADPPSGKTRYAGWLRRSAITGEAILAGLYETCVLPGREGRFFKGVYPLPGGCVAVIFRPENRPDGSLTLVSDGRRFGEEGYYRVHRTGAGTLRVKTVPMTERLHVAVGTDGGLRARQDFVFCGVRFLVLRYEISRHPLKRSGAAARLTGG